MKKRATKKVPEATPAPPENQKLNMVTATPLINMSGWLKVTSQKTGYFVYVPLPIRLIVQLPDEKGGGCIVRGAHGDESTTKESIVEILKALNGYPVGGWASSWCLAG